MRWEVSRKSASLEIVDNLKFIDQMLTGPLCSL